MDFSTLLANIDKHKYVTVSEFVSDTDLIWQNALKFNPTGEALKVGLLIRTDADQWNRPMKIAQMLQVRRHLIHLRSVDSRV